MGHTVWKPGNVAPINANIVSADDSGLAAAIDAHSSTTGVTATVGGGRNLHATASSLKAARSRIRDADFASETAALTRARVLQDASAAVPVQADSAPKVVLALPGGGTG